ncbi:MAG: hypothetical protein JWO56_3318 [Acidobacteria bacterium]|nr:hypothetical protein [Acidobacteriota bacterium]
MGVGKWGTSIEVMSETFAPSAAALGWRWINALGNQLTVAGARAAGVSAPFDSLTTADIASERKLKAMTIGSPVIELGGTVLNGDPLTSDSVGRAVKWTPGAGYINGHAREGGDSGDRIRIFFAPSGLVAGTATLVAGVATVATPFVAAGSIILVSYNTCAGTPGTQLQAKTVDITAGVSFVIRSVGGGSDTSTVNWTIVN